MDVLDILIDALRAAVLITGIVVIMMMILFFSMKWNGQIDRRRI